MSQNEGHVFPASKLLYLRILTVYFFSYFDEILDLAQKENLINSQLKKIK